MLFALIRALCFSRKRSQMCHSCCSWSTRCGVKQRHELRIFLRHRLIFCIDICISCDCFESAAFQCLLLRPASTFRWIRWAFPRRCSCGFVSRGSVDCASIADVARSNRSIARLRIRQAPSDDKLCVTHSWLKLYSFSRSVTSRSELDPWRVSNFIFCQWACYFRSRDVRACRCCCF